MFWCLLAIFSLARGDDTQDESRGFETCDGNIDLEKPYRIVVDANNRGNADKLLFQPFDIPSSSKDLEPNDLLIQVKAAGINYIDTYHRSGLYPGVTKIGLEGSGIVTMTGDKVTKYTINDKVFWFSIQGSYSTHLIVNEDTISLIKFTDDMLDIIQNEQDPENDKDTDYIYKVGASIGIQVLTAHYLANSITNINADTSVLIHSGAGGTGNILIQIIKNILKSKLLISTVSTEYKQSIAKSAGADQIIVGYDGDGFYDQVMRLTGNEGVDIVFDGVGRSTWEHSLKCVKQRGWIVYFGNASGKIPNIDILELTKQGSVSLIRPSLRHYVRNKAEIDARYNDVFKWMKDGQLEIKIGHEFKLYDVKQAQQMLESRLTVNKIVLVP